MMNDNKYPTITEYPLCPADAVAMIAVALRGLQVWVCKNQDIDAQIAMRDRDPEGIALRVVLATMTRR